MVANQALSRNYVCPNMLDEKRLEIVHTNKIVEGKDSALAAAKRGKDTSLWLAVESLKPYGIISFKIDTDIVSDAELICSNERLLLEPSLELVLGYVAGVNEGNSPSF